jgi:Metalloenzyme superfamily
MVAGPIRGALVCRRERGLRVGPLFLGLAILFAVGCGGGAGGPTLPDAAPSAPPPPPRVVILSIDGLRPEGLLQAQAPNIVGMTSRGAYTLQARTVMPSNTLPAHVSMLTGYPPSVHGVTWDDEYRADRTLKVPTLLGAVHAEGMRTVMVVGKSKLYHLNVTGTCDTYVLTGRGDVDVANEAVVQLGTSFGLMFVHFPDTDLAGHQSGWLSASYEARIATVDEAVGRILRALPPNTTVILTADHGGEGRNHGSASSTDMTIPWIITGPMVPPNHRLTQRVTVMDTAATAAYVLGLSLPADVTGKVVLEAFAPPAS